MIGILKSFDEVKLVGMLTGASVCDTTEVEQEYKS